MIYRVRQQMTSRIKRSILDPFNAVSRRGFRAVLLVFMLLSVVSGACSYAPTASKDAQRPSASKYDGEDRLVIPVALEKHRAKLMRELPIARALVERRLGQSVPPIQLYLSADADAMKRLAQRNHGALPPSWSAGLAFPRQRVVYLPVTAHAALPSLLRHELVHIALGGHPIPLWINEGVAVALGEGLSFERLWTLNEAAAAHALHDFNDLSRRFPVYGRPAQVAYAQSGHFIHHLTQNEGDEAFHQWMDAVIQGQEPRVASERFFVTPLHDHETQWRARLTRGPLAWFALFAKSETVWAFAIIIFWVLGRRKLRQRWTAHHVTRSAQTSAPSVVTAPSISVARRDHPRYTSTSSPYASTRSSPVASTHSSVPRAHPHSEPPSPPTSSQ